MKAVHLLVTVVLAWRSLRVVAVVRSAASKKVIHQALTGEFFYTCIAGFVLWVMLSILKSYFGPRQTIGSDSRASAWQRSRSTPQPVRTTLKPRATALDRHLRDHAAEFEQEHRTRTLRASIAPALPLIDSLFTMSAQQLHSLVQRASHLATITPTVHDAADPVVSERERGIIHREVHAALTSFNAPHEGLEPRVSQLPESAVGLDGRVDCGRAKNVQMVSTTVYNIEMRLPQTRTRYAWVYAHEYSHIIVHGHALACQAFGESAREEALAELLALLCVVHLSENSPTSNMYSRDFVAQTLRNAFAGADDARQYSAFARSRAETLAHIYGGGLGLALDALSQNSGHMLDDDFIPYFLRVHFAGDALPVSPCTSHSG